uniref:MotA/TolQ/ExbB proton channel family protein n=1 Tax=uncultured Nevskia sp. TaxID=228950 RepID=UPI0025EB6D91
MSGTFSLTQLVLEATIPVKLVIGVLIAASLASWAVILAKRGLLSRIQNQAVAFETRFWSGGSMDDLYESHRRGGEPEEGLPLIFRAGYEEFKRQQVANIPPDDALAAVQRQMRVVMARETEKLEGGLSLLATIGSTSPYVGLLGTVWGIVNAFVSIGNVKQATLASVAPGIAEALIATAIGLF